MPEKAGIKNSRRVAGVVSLMLALVWTAYLYTNYDRTTQTLDLFGNELVFGEEEHEEHAALEDEYHEQEDD